MEDKKVKYAIGDQDFKSLRGNGFLYVDKTKYIQKLVEGSKYYFLARPRRFGKSLFLSTLRYFFEGQRELFQGLYIDSINWTWEAYPVLYLDLNTDKFAEQGVLDDLLDNQFKKWENTYGITDIAANLSTRFHNIIEATHEKTGRQAVILIDEYDKPLSGNIRKSEIFEHYRSRLASIYSNLKSSAEHIRFVFLTGISRFSKLSVFSDLNNLYDISFSDEFANICGITEQELLDNFQHGISALSDKYEISYQDMCGRLKKNYDGYRFAPKGSDIYNPWSVLCAMRDLRIDDFWASTGAPTIISEALHDADVDVERILNARWRLRRLAGLDILNTDPTALLYQTGYLTMSEYDLDTDTVRLKVPNEEVTKALFNDLLKFYVKTKRREAASVVEEIIDTIRYGEPEEMMRSLNAYFAGIPYDLKMDNENNFHNAFYILMTLIGIDTQAEIHTSAGRIDILIETPKYIYIIELKYDASPEQALRQIKEKQYARRFSTDSRRIFKIGVSFSSKTRRIEGWAIDS